MKFFLKDSAWRLLNLVPGSMQGRASILMYHSFGDNAASFTVSEEAFERQLQILKASGLHVVPLSELVDTLVARKDTSGMVAITIDDGYKDAHDTAFPLLQKYQIPAAVFIPTDLVGKEMTNSQGVTLPILSGEEIGQMQKSGLVEFYSHTLTHATLSQLPLSEAIREISESHTAIERLGGDPAVFAYPKGKYTPEILEYMRRSPYRAALTVKPGLVHPDSDLFQLPRNGINSATTDVQFKGFISRTVERYERWRQIVQRASVAWFCARDLTVEVMRGKTLYRVLLNWSLQAHRRSISGRVLDIAGGGSPSYYRYLAQNLTVTHTDSTKSGAGFVDMNKPLPYTSGAYDTVLLINAIYIAEAPRALLSECHRVLRPGGLLCVASPFLMNEMREPHDYVRFTSEGLEREVRAVGFSAIRIQPIGERMTAAANSVGALLAHSLLRPLRLLLYALALLMDALVPKRFSSQAPAPIAYIVLARA